MAQRHNSVDFKKWSKISGAVVGVAFAVVWIHTEASRLERQIRPLQKEVDRLQYENARLQMHLNQWMTPSHMDQIAREQMNLQPLDPKNLIAIEQAK